MSTNKSLELDKLRDELANEYRKPNWPRKSEHDRPNRYDTRMLYEVGDDVEQAYSDGFDKCIEILESDDKRLELTTDVSKVKLSKEPVYFQGNRCAGCANIFTECQCKPASAEGTEK